MDPSQEAERLRLFVSRITDYAIYMLAPDGTVSSWNAGAQRFKGYTADEIIGQHFSRFYTPEDRAAGIPEKALRLARETGKFEAEGWRMRKDGTRFWAHVVLDPIRDENGELIGFAKITRDISEKRAAQEALRESEERFRMLVQGVTDYAIYMLSPEGSITNWNAGAHRIKQYEQDEVLGSHFSRFYTEEDREAGKPAYALEQARTKGRFESEGWRVRKDGTRFWAHVVIDPIHNDKGELVGFAKITRDITERQQAALALEKARDSLYQSQKLEAIGKLTGGVAHDFNNLLSVITNGLDLLRPIVKDPEGAGLITSMEKAAMRGASLTNQLLTFARQQPVTPEPRDLNRVITAFEPVLRRATRSSVKFEIHVAGQLPAVMVDVALFETALLNLVVNANDATLDGGSISVATAAVQLREGEIGRLAEGSYVVVSVGDTGSGMTEEVIARAIEPFFTTKAVGKGTGLGLSQVYGMVQQFGGDLKITSQVAQGTTVALYFPVSTEEAVEDSLPPPSDKVLIVDDQPDVLEMASEMFRTLGFHVITATSGRQALEILSRTPDIHLLFSDVVMPGSSGVELGRKAQEISPNTRVLLASGYTTPAGSLKGFEFLPKPYRIADILKKLRALG
ncbi:hybrid sensor histidine kinase/response regulator [Ramlibacter albus]|uniref:histidine kinase n=1 Tax=Ramlibacter albus TaxID=2079448 RepID=A0A923MDA3_9BURK|nr:PAS domain-containing sensor histidine kinase [Ramlibacter albus]MBC5768585.1 PAS domain S-box protein [Ramlibacter albus]